MRLSLGFSPCPNDTFIFDAIVNKKIDCDGFEFDIVMEDIQTLNSWAEHSRLDITKLSFPALFENSSSYDLLDSGAAMGKGVGPLLIAKKLVDIPDLINCSVAIPGINTTANFLLSFAFPYLTKKIPMLFSEIEDAVLNDQTDLGVIIHENRFTYQQKGLIKVFDLGEIWEERQNAPIPLAGIVAKSSLDKNIQLCLSNLIRKSVEYGFSNYPLLSSFTIENAQAMEEDVMRKHIELYVNNYSIQLGEEGRMAINQLKKVYDQQMIEHS